MKWTARFPYDLDPWELDDQLVDLSLAEEGAFHRLLRYQWRYGQVPPSFERLAAICGCSLPTMTKMWKNALKPLFPKGRNNPLNTLREKAQEKSRKFSANAKRRLPRQKEEPEVSRETWATPYGKVWKARFGGDPPWGQVARFVKPLHDEHGLEITLPAFIRFCAEADPKYVSLSRFSQTFGAWLPSQPTTPSLSEMTP